ncbi:MAG: glycosyltransferase family 2 protein [Lachnospiraceae bacterium]|nr:glycosyltransferase family 2 protein [Lachnospiraceae bacterium]
MPKVSIVIPVYNMQKYLDKCMQGIFSQTLEDIEIVLVDDGSSDDSPRLCDEYAKKDSRVRVIHKENGGLTSAWKRGSLEATGEYIGYVDSDDYVETDMYEKLYNRAVATGADIVCCGLTHLYEDDPQRKWTEQMELGTDSLQKKELSEVLYPTLINDGSFMGRRLQPNRVAKLVRSSLVKKNLDRCADEVSIGEDYQFSLCMFLDAERVEIIRDYFPYYYYMNNASMTMRHDRNYPDKIRIMRENLCRISDEKNVYDLKPQIWNDYVCLLVLHVKSIVYKQKTSPYRELKKEMKQVLTQPDVVKALEICCMPKLTLAEKLFLFFMKHQMYAAIWLVVRLYFRS